MTVSDILKLPSLCSAKVVAGASGMGNDITGAMILEAIDIENWGQHGQLIITSFYALQHLSAQEVRDFFEKLSHIGIGAIIFKSERLLSTLPENVIQLSDQHMIPLLQISKDVKYESILMDVLGSILDSNLALLNRFFEVHNQMMTLALKQPSVFQILSYLKETIGTHSTFFDTSNNKKTGSAPSLTQFTDFKLKPARQAHYQHYQYYDVQLHYTDHLVKDAFAVSIPSSIENRYYLIIHTKYRNLEPLDIMTIENVVSLLQMEVLKQQAIRQQLFIQNNNMIRDLLNNRYDSHRKIDSLLGTIKLDSHPFYQVLMLSIHLSGSQEEHRLDLMFQIRKAIRALYPNIAYLENNDQIVFLHNFPLPAQAIHLKDVERVLNQLCKVPHGESSRFSYLAALSSSTDRYNIGKINREVMDICRLFDWRQHENLCISYEDIGIYKLFLGADNPNAFAAYLDPRVLKLHKEDPAFFETLITLCENNMNLQETAQQLFLHPKTVRYRISRIQQLYHLDPKNTDDFLQILFAKRIFSLMTP